MKAPIFTAALNDDVNSLTSLIQSNEKLVEERDEFGFTPLNYALEFDSFAAAETLLRHGADPNARNEDGIMPVHLAATIEMINLLVRHGVSINAVSNDGRTPLIVQAANPESIEVMRELIRLGADVNVKSNKGVTALDVAELRQEQDKIDLLLQHGGERGAGFPSVRISG